MYSYQTPYIGRVPAVAECFPDLKMVDFRGNQFEGKSVFALHGGMSRNINDEIGESPSLVREFLALSQGEDLSKVDNCSHQEHDETAPVVESK